MNVIKRVLHFTTKLLKEFVVNGRSFGYAYASYGLLWWLCFYVRTPFSYKLSSYAMRKKTAWLDKYITKNYSYIINRYINSSESSVPVSEHKIWVFWGQGEENMPPLIKACYRQLTQFNNNVVLITTKNVNEYISLSDVIYDKVKTGKITWAHFSDIVRTTLLSKYGGLWIDATVWVPSGIPLDKLKEMPIYTANGKVVVTSRSICFWTSFQWNWSSWCMWSKDAGYPLFSFVSEMLQSLAIRENAWLDYVIQDYLIYYAICHIPGVKQDIENIKIHNDKRNELASMMNQPFDIETYKKMAKSDFVFKLSYRSPWIEKVIDGKQTFYGRILSGIIKI